jgi:hypothetical protein
MRCTSARHRAARLLRTLPSQVLLQPSIARNAYERLEHYCYSSNYVGRVLPGNSTGNPRSGPHAAIQR